MRNGVRSTLPICLVLALAIATPSIFAQGDGLLPLFKREQRRVMYHDPEALPPASAYGAEYSYDFDPPTLQEPREYRASRPITLDQALQVALENVEVIRTLNNTNPGARGRTIYDPAIANTTVDQQQAVFDPTVTLNNTWSQDESPGGTIDSSTGVIRQGTVTESYNLNFNASQKNSLGGTSSFSFNEANVFNPNVGFGTLNPFDRFSTEVSYTQPLLRGAGVAANQAPITIARLNAEQSFFQFRGSMQDYVRGVIEAYWNVVTARTVVWAREKQIEQATLALERAEARLRVGSADVTEVTQAKSALASFKAQKITADGTLLNSESALMNILGLPAALPERLVPTTPPTAEKVAFDPSETFRLAEQRRPDIIELKLIWEADLQQHILRKNEMLPTLNAAALYRWDGLVGTRPASVGPPPLPEARRSTKAGEYTDWQLGINFSVPLLLRQERANVRSAEMVLARDRAYIKQAIHATEHLLAITLRQAEQSYLRYEAFREAREAARINLERQFAASNAGTDVILLNVLQAISDWGNAVSQEADALLQYNVTLATLERETGTILETHGIFFVEDQRCNVGPMWLGHKRNRLYPYAHRPTLNDPRYEAGDEPSEEFFDLEDYPGRMRDERRAAEAAADEKAELPPMPAEPDASPDDDRSAVLPLLRFLKLK